MFPSVKTRFASAARRSFDLALEFIDRSGGKLTIDSEPGQGATVRMVFPQATAP